MQSIELIRDNLTKSRDRVLLRIEDMREHAVVFPTPRGGCHTLWILGHLAFIEGLVVQQFMLGEENPVADWQTLFDGDEVHGDASQYPSFDDTLSRCREMRESTLKLLDGFSEADMDKASITVPTGYEDTFGTWRHCLQYVSDHWYMHRGQLADARRSAGIERMWV